MTRKDTPPCWRFSITRWQPTKVDPSSRLRLEHRELALHECVAVASESPAVVGLEPLDLPALHSLPRALMAYMIGQLVKPAIVADDKDVVVGDGAEGLVALIGRRSPMGLVFTKKGLA